jgi:hypothetical protein
VAGVLTHALSGVPTVASRGTDMVAGIDTVTARAAPVQLVNADAPDDTVISAIPAKRLASQNLADACNRFKYLIEIDSRMM